MRKHVLRFKRRTRLWKAIQYIRVYCYKHRTCDGCLLWGADGSCLLEENVPADWPVEIEAALGGDHDAAD